MLGKRIINSNDAISVACTTNTNDYPTTNLAYYKMSSPEDEKGTYNGTATNVNFNVAGKFGNAGNFSGGASYVNLNSAVLPASVFSVSLWINLDSLSPAWLFSQYTGGATGRFIFNVTPTGGFQINVTSTNSLATTNIPVITVGNWHHVVIVKDGSNGWTLYADGTPHSTWNSTENILTNQNTVLGGDDSVTGNNMIGRLDQVRIFNTALDSTQVASLYNEVYCVPTIVPTNNFNTVLYTGDGTSSNAITGVGFEPNLIWIKDRFAASGHWVSDSVRGAGNGLMTQSTGAEITSLPELMSSFDSDGFTVGYISNNTTNFLNNSYVAWNWKAGGAAVSNTDGTITSQVSANVDAGFSIVKYTGNGISASLQKVGTGLNQECDIVFIKNLDNTASWVTQRNKTDVNKYLYLNDTRAESTSTAFKVDINTNEGTFGFTSNNAGVNALNNDYVAYAFHSVDGMSKIGSYVGTGASGNSIVTGFRPAFVMTKRTDIAGYNWYIWDNKRSPTNPRDKVLEANVGGAEQDFSAFPHNFLSNGFSVDTTNASFNANGGKYIFMAFAEEAFVADNFFNDDSTVATYKLNGDAGDDSGSGYNGTASNITYAAGKFDEAAVFNGSSSFIDTNVNFTNFLDGDYTVSMWVNKDVDAQNFFAGTVSSTGALNGIYFRWNESTNASPNAIGFLERNTTTTATSIFSTTGYTFGQWIHVVGVRSGGTNFLYVNGTLQGSAANQNINHATDFTLGRAGAYASNAFDGSIDQVRIFNRALGSGEVTALYNE